MEHKMSVLIVEDEGIVALGLENMLQLEGYEVTGIADNGKEALEIIKKETVDLVLLDIQIKGEWDGVETARQLSTVRNIPFIYLTAFSDEETVERARETFPAAYLTKPYQARSLMIAIDLALHNFAFRKQPSGKQDADKVIPLFPRDRSPGTTDQKEAILYFNDAVFIKQNYKFIKVRLNEINYLQAEGNYTGIFTLDKKYIIRHTLSALLEKLNRPNLSRVHRSFAVNMEVIDHFNETTIFVGEKEIPLGRYYKEGFFQNFDFR